MLSFPVMENPFFKLPSVEHRAHIRRFLRSDLTDEEDCALRGYVAWRRLEFALRAKAELEERRSRLLEDDGREVQT